MGVKTILVLEWVGVEVIETNIPEIFTVFTFVTTVERDVTGETDIVGERDVIAEREEEAVGVIV